MMTFAFIPQEFTIGGVYMPPSLIAGLIALALAILTARLLNKYRLSKYVFYPPLVFVALLVIYTMLINFLFLPI